MAWFTCMAGVGGKGNSVIVTCDADFAGIPITCTNGQKTYTKVCPSFSPYEVTFSGLVAGTWTISATVDGVVYSTTAIVTDITAVLSYGFNWQMWVDSSSSLHSEDYNDLSDLLSDEAAIRQLFTEHAPTDYAASTATVTPDLATVLNNDLCAKWINLSDYALDTLYANPLIAAEMDNADKYFYGEWGIVDDTTTPPTWGAKGNVPVMTANNAPYGEASASNASSGYEAYRAFSDIADSRWVSTSTANAYIQYKSVNPINVKKIGIEPSFDNLMHRRIKNWKYQASNDGVTFIDVYSGQCEAVIKFQIFDIENNNYYLYHRILVIDTDDNNTICIRNLQFYGRELKASVPKMTGNNAPYCEASVNGTIQYSYPPYYLFDKVVATNGNFITILDAVAGTNYYQIKMDKPIIPRLMRMFGNYDGSYLLTGRVDASKDGATYTTIKPSFEFNHTGNGAITTILIDTDEEYQYFRLYPLTWQTVCSFSEWEIFGEDYSEKEFEEGTTKKWLYDHGVELETSQIVTTGNGSVTKSDSSFLVSDGATSTSASAFALIGFNSVNVTSYSVMRCIVGEILTSDDSAVGNINVRATLPSGLNDAGRIASLDIPKPLNNPNTISLDISNVNQSVYVCCECGYIANRRVEYKEVWLE